MNIDKYWFKLVKANCSNSHIIVDIIPGVNKVNRNYRIVMN